ncbi:cell filamentation protein Fic [Endozoicomonas sp. OPT23]|uniref:Fic family protein n=1 Tax=Endozoicomonas sp. OPT23 TaxID=2072845 RepID=UPI00129ACAE1|nr:Fic family protein [Endozoicomonas sp. OPT23]MRI31392.1 cell filamentation protein Fic [Endozoicomonas sp. OPT23]
MHTLERLSEYRFTASQLSRFRQLGEFRGRQHQTVRLQPEVLETLRQVTLLESVEYGNSLERITASREVIRKLVQQDAKPVTPSERQLAGYRDLLDMVIEPPEHTNLSTGLVRQLHAQLYSHFPHEGGRWKATNKVIVERDKEGNRKGILYRTVPAAETPLAMESTVALYHDSLSKGIEPLLVVSCAVLDFLCIHPFSDGNARIARLLATLMLSLNGYDVCRYISLERIFAEDEEAYLSALQQSVKGWHEGTHNPMPWINFFLISVIKAYEELEARVEGLRERGSRAPKSKLITIAIEEHKGPFSVADICLELPNVSRELVKKVIQQMRKNGDLKAFGKGRGAHWQKVS